MNTSRLRQTLFSFATRQGAAQAIQIISGFALVRYMDIHEYGVAAFLLAVQASAGILSDLGLRDGIIAVIGQNAFDKFRLGSLVGAAMHQRRLNLLPVSIGILAAFILFHFLQDVPWPVVLALAAMSIINNSFVGWTIYFALPWMLRQDMKAYYKPQLLFQTARLALLLLCIAFNFLDVITLAIANTFATCGTALWYRYKSAELLDIPAQVSRDDMRHLRRYLLPLLPLSIFSAFQDQVTFFILAIVGQATNIAQAFALGRLAIVFQFFGTATLLLATPWIAKAPDENLPKRYAVVLGSAVTLAAATLLGALLFPDLFLWILGHQYQGLYVELGLALGAASATFLYGVLYYINNSRRWTWPWTGTSYVIAIVTIQALCIVFLDMSQTRNALLMSLLVGVAMVILQLLHTILGFAFKTIRKKKAPQV